MRIQSLEPRKLPKQARARVTQSVILEGATQVLAAESLEGFNTNAVAERAGTSIGTLYQYFPNKEALLLALIHQQKRQMLMNIAQSMRAAKGEDLEGAVRLLVAGRVQHLRENSKVAWILSNQESSLPIHDVRIQYFTQGIELFRHGLDHWGEKARGIDSTLASKTVPALIRGIMESWLSEDHHGLNVAEEEAVQSVWGYLQSHSTIARKS